MMKALSRSSGSIKALRKDVGLWWLKMTDQEQRDVVRRGFVVAGTAFSACILLPAIGVRYDTQRTEAEFRAGAKAFVQAETPQDAILADNNAASLLKHDWLRSVGYSVERDPRASLSRYAMHARDKGALSSIAPDLRTRFETADLAVADYDCLSKAVYYEAGHERTEGKIAVAEVILNRVADHRYPNSVCDVVFQGATRTTGCQFTFTCDGALGRKPDEEKWEAAQEVAAHVLMDLHEPRTRSATHYHATYVDPIWNVGLVRTNKIGAHIFYRFPRGGEWAKARNAVARKRAYRARLASYKSKGYGVVPGRAELEAVNSLQLSETSAAPAP